LVPHHGPREAVLFKGQGPLLPAYAPLKKNLKKIFGTTFRDNNLTNNQLTPKT
jgi:hypothetical protein